MIPNFQELIDLIIDHQLMTATLSSPWKTAAADVAIKISIRPVKIKGDFLYQIASYTKEQVFHRNVSAATCAEVVQEMLTQQYKQGIFETPLASYHLLVNKKKQMTVIKKEKKAAADKPGNKLPVYSEHNRKKSYLIPEGIPVSFLVTLGVMTTEGKVVAKKYDKFRQINRFLEMVDDIAAYLPEEGVIEVVDFGCGKAYLTFALYHYLHHIKQRTVHITGLDLKKDVIGKCQQLAKDLSYKDLHFLVGDINHYETEKNPDLLITLHACDIATDAALEKGMRWGCKVILSVPCCQHELLSQIDSPPLNSLLRHGILKERFSALVTDAARAELLTMYGYDVQIIEFIDMEHTPKNLLLRAVKSENTQRQQASQERYALFKETLQITPCLEILVSKQKDTHRE